MNVGRLGEAVAAFEQTIFDGGVPDAIDAGVVGRGESVLVAVASVGFRNVPSFVVARGVAAAGVEVDVAWGGALYAVVPAARLGLRVVPDQLRS